MDFQFNDKKSEEVFVAAYSKDIPFLSEEYRNYAAVIATEIYKLISKEYLSSEEYNRYRALMDAIDRHTKLIESDRRNAERLTKQELLVRNDNSFTTEDFDSAISTIVSAVLKCVDKTQHLAVLGSLREVREKILSKS